MRFLLWTCNEEKKTSEKEINVKLSYCVRHRESITRSKWLVTSNQMSSVLFFRCIKWEKRDNERIQKKKVTKSRCSLVNVVSLYISMYRWRICRTWEPCSRTIAQTSSVISIFEGASLMEGVIRLTMSRKRWCARKSKRFATTRPVSSFDGTRRFLFEWQVDRSLFPKTLDEQRSLLIRVNAILAANIELAALRESDQTSFSIEPSKNHCYGRSSSHCQRNCYVPAWKPATWSTRSHFFSFTSTNI